MDHPFVMDHHHIRCAIAVEVATRKREGREAIPRLPTWTEPGIPIELSLPGVEVRLPQHPAVAARPGEGGAAPGPGVPGVGQGLPHGGDDVGEAVAIEVAGRGEAVETPPGFGRPGAKRPQLAVDRTPEVIEAIAIEVSQPGPGQAVDRVYFVARRGRQEMDDRRQGMVPRAGWFGLSRQGTAQRDNQHRPAVRPAAPPP